MDPRDFIRAKFEDWRTGYLSEPDFKVALRQYSDTLRARGQLPLRRSNPESVEARAALGSTTL
jgi:hypothetical protein